MTTELTYLVYASAIPPPRFIAWLVYLLGLVLSILPLI